MRSAFKYLSHRIVILRNIFKTLRASYLCISFSVYLYSYGMQKLQMMLNLILFQYDGGTQRNVISHTYRHIHISHTSQMWYISSYLCFGIVFKNFTRITCLWSISYEHCVNATASDVGCMLLMSFFGSELQCRNLCSFLSYYNEAKFLVIKWNKKIRKFSFSILDKCC